MTPNLTTVIPAKAGIHLALATSDAVWIPACAGMTDRRHDAFWET